MTTRQQAPTRTANQRLAALQHANWIRVERAKLKQAINARETTVRDVLADVPSYAAGMKFAALIGAQRGWGERRVKRFLARAAISPVKTVAGLSDRQASEAKRLLGAG